MYKLWAWNTHPVTDVRALGVSLDMTVASSMHCREAALTARRLLFMIHRSFSDLSKAAFIPLYRVIVRQHLEYAMEINFRSLKADINQLERVQCLATRLGTGLRHVLYEERLRQLNRADFILAFKIFKGRFDLSRSDFLLCTPRAGLRGLTYRLLQGPGRLYCKPRLFMLNFPPN